MKKIILSLILVIISLLFFNTNKISQAATCCTNGPHNDLTCTPCLTNPLGEGKTNINIIIGQIINAVLGVVGSLALLMFIYGR